MLTRMRFAGLLSLALALAIGVLPEGPAWAQPNDPPSNIFSGSIEDIDPSGGKIKIKTDLGKVIVLETNKSDLLKNLAPSDQVTVELNADGKVTKITKVAVPELKAPLGAKP